MDSQNDTTVLPAEAPSKPAPSRQTARQTQPQTLPPYNVVLLDDDEHSYQYVIEMLGRLFGYSTQKAFKLAEEVDRTGRVIVYTTHREVAELKREQIHGFGADQFIASSAGPMSAIIEPAMA
jgi:ATP-dependent Clp protease adaptor protein ClpS